MSHGRIIDKIKYICLYNDNELKKKSLEDNVYFTLRDIFNNANCVDTVFAANDYNHTLTNGICFEDRTLTFQYTKILYDKKYLLSLIKFLNYLNISYFTFIENKPKLQTNEYIKFDEWWIQFKELKKLLNKQYKII